MPARVLITVGGMVLCAAALWRGGWAWSVVTLLSALLLLGSWQRAFRWGERPFLPTAAFAGMTAALIGLAWLPPAAQGPALFASLWVFLFGTLLAALWRFPRISPLESAGGTVLITLYVTVGASALLLLRHLEGPTAPWPAGLRWSLLALAATWGTQLAIALRDHRGDRPSLAPSGHVRLTWEGLVAGLSAGTLIGLATGLALRFLFWQGLAVGILCGLLTPLGSLAVSALRSGLRPEGEHDPWDRLWTLNAHFEGLLVNVPLVYLLALVWQ